MTGKVLMKNDIKFLVIHCSDTPNSNNLSAIDIHKMHAINFLCAKQIKI